MRVSLLRPNEALQCIFEHWIRSLRHRSRFQVRTTEPKINRESLNVVGWGRWGAYVSM